MKKFMIPTIILLFLSYGIIYAKDFSGTYGLNENGDIITLSLIQDNNGKVTGTISLEGIEYSIKGHQHGNRIIGFLNAYDESLNFSALLDNDNLLLTLSDTEDMQVEHNDSFETLIFQRQKHKAGVTPNKTMTPEKSKSHEAVGKGKVIINGVALSKKQVSELVKIYNVKPLPGKYWYDARSGLYGVVGFPAFSFMLAGHKYGNLDRNASNGNTGVFVNGRELPQSEWAVWSQLLGYIIQPGAYWLDGNGNAGYEGNPIPTENLYMAAQRNAYRGSGSGGDNTWSTWFGAGNYDSGNQRGYVNVIGHGPVGYGF
jgi:hypothetical protein